MTLFRFTALRKGTTRRTLASLRYGTLFLQSPTKFNDPFDCQLVFDPALTPDEMDTVRYICSKQPNNPSAQAILNAIRRQGANAGLAIQRAIEAAFQRAGICCFSETWENPLMWGHYADEHRGFCLEFEADTNALGGCSLLPALYSDGHFPARVFQFLVDRSAFFAQMLLTKQMEWSYEREWRLIRHTGGLLNPSPLRLKAVIFGCRSDAKNEAKIRRALKRSNGVDFWRVVKSTAGFSFSRVPA